MSTMTSELGVQFSHFDFLENVPNIIGQRSHEKKYYLKKKNHIFFILHVKILF